jgi:excisionase family DNA binding protein
VHTQDLGEDRLLTADEVGILLRISRKAVYALIERQQLPGVRRIGRRVRIDRRELLDWLDHTCASSPQERRR